MRTYFCVDVSGSMSDDDISRARMIIADRIKPGDHVYAFDARHYYVGQEPLGREALHKIHGFPRGGTDPASLLEAIASDAGAEEHRKVLLSDGFMAPEHLAAFDEFVNVHPEGT